MSLKQLDLSSDLICQTCNKQFDQVNKFPLILPGCGHSYCHECLDGAFILQQKKLSGTQNQETAFNPSTYFIGSKSMLVQCPEDEICVPQNIVTADQLQIDEAKVQMMVQKEKQEEAAAKLELFQKKKLSKGLSSQQVLPPAIIQRKVSQTDKQQRFSMQESMNQSFSTRKFSNVQIQKKAPVIPKLSLTNINIQASGSRNFEDSQVVQEGFQTVRTPQSQYMTSSNTVLNTTNAFKKKFARNSSNDCQKINQMPAMHQQFQLNQIPQELSQQNQFNLMLPQHSDDHDNLRQSGYIKAIQQKTNQNQGSQIQSNWRDKFLEFKIDHSAQQEAMLQQQILSQAPQKRVIMCLEHGKPRELICVNCKKKCCHTCALFGACKTHDVREHSDTINDIQNRMEVLLEMFQMVETNYQQLKSHEQLTLLRNTMAQKELNLKENVSRQYQKWRDILTTQENEMHNKIRDNFSQFDSLFDEELQNDQACEGDGEMWQKQVQDLVDNYTNAMENDSDYIAYEILDNNPINEQSLEFLYSAAEVWIESIEQRQKYTKLQNLESQYEKIQLWFEPQFEKRVSNIGLVNDLNKKSSSFFQKSKFKSSGVSSKKSGLESDQKISIKSSSNIPTGFDSGAKTLLTDHTPQKVQILEVDHIYPIEGPTQQTSFQKSHEAIEPPILDNDMLKNSLKSMLDQAQSSSQKMEDLDISSISFTNEATIPKWQTEQFKLILKEQIKELMSQYQDSQAITNLQSQNQEPAINEDTEVKQPEFVIKQIEPPQQLVETELKLDASDKSVSQGSSMLEPNSTDQQQNFVEDQNLKATEPDADLPCVAQKEEEKTEMVSQPLKKSGIGKPSKFSLSESFKLQSQMGDIDLSSKNITDNHSMQLCQLIKSHASTGVTNLDLSSNKITDNGIVNICKAINDTQIERLVFSNNKLTDKCTEVISGALMRNKNLKTLNLMGNQINNRVSKNKLINQLKKIDVLI